MDLDLEKFIDGLKDDAGVLAKSELKGFINWAVSDDDAFVKDQASRMARYMKQLAGKLITKDEFDGYMENMKDLAEMQALANDVTAKASAQRFVDGLKNLVIGGLSKLV